MADPDLLIRQGPVYPDPEIRGWVVGGGGLKKMFSALRALVWSNNKAPPLDPPLRNTRGGGGLHFSYKIILSEIGCFC